MPIRSSGSARVFYPSHDRDSLLAALREGVTSLKVILPVTSVVLFGSWATGRATAFSDIDLLVIYSGPHRDDAYRTVRVSIPVRGLEPHIYTEEEATTLRSVLGPMTRAGIPLL